MKKILIKQCSPKLCEDGYRELWIDDNLIMKGDLYHDKIRHQIQGFLECFQFLNMEFEVETQTIECKFSCG